MMTQNGPFRATLARERARSRALVHCTLGTVAEEANATATFHPCLRTARALATAIDKVRYVCSGRGNAERGMDRSAGGVGIT